MNCLWCDDEIIPEVGWANLLIPSKPELVCGTCKKELEVITGKRCRKCSRVSQEIVCRDCQWWEQHTEGDDPLTFNMSVFHYNPFMQDVISRWKYRGDYCLGEILKSRYAAMFREEFIFLPENAIVVPIPLSDERLDERGFNQSAVLAGFLPIETESLLTRKHSEKQSKKTRRERIGGENPFELSQSVNKPVLLADDIYTTGATLRHAATLLKEHGCPSVHALTLVRG